MKKFICLVMTFVMLFSIINVVSAEETNVPEKVEIAFKVGDSTIMINSVATTVETPYIAGAGTTLVPLRVITEAFGARVTWVNETKEIILEYPDVNITLQIGNKNAKVNDHTEVLPEAPVLSPNGVTMVPLRFISETFGATVGYDNATASITVVKENAAEDDKISSSTDLPKIGDSYWNWSMMTPASMMMTDRALDGNYTLFESENEAELWVEIYNTEDVEDLAYNRYYKTLKSEMQSIYTLSKDQKSKDASGNEFFRIIGRDKVRYMDVYAVYRDDILFRVCVVADVGDEQIPSMTTILESFKADFEHDGQTHDLSNVEDDGYRLISDDDLKVSFKVPATMGDMKTDRMNLLWLVSRKKGDCTEVTVGIYSKTEDVTSKSIAQDDRLFHENYYNPEKTSTTELFPYTEYPTGENPYYYLFTTRGLSKGDYQMADVYFEKGEYVYNVTVTAPVGKNDVFHKVMETLECETLDSESVGVVLREERDVEPYESVVGNWKMTLNSSWDETITGNETGKDSQMSMYTNKYLDAVLTVTTASIPTTKPKELQKAVEEWYGEQSKMGERIGRITEGVSGQNAFYKFVIRLDADEDGEIFYYTAYILKKRTRMVVFELIESEEIANHTIANEVLEIIGSFDFTE